MGREILVGSARQLFVVAGEQSFALQLPESGTLSIGRSPGCSVCINDPSVSRSHAALHIAKTLVIQDLGSANGTMVCARGERAVSAETLNMRRLVGKRSEVMIGDTLLVGAARMVVRHAPSRSEIELASRGTESDPVMVRVHEDARRVAPTPITVMLLGETGVGKEVLARTIHASSDRANKPFVAVNCAALSETLLESELFGHERGAFTGAQEARAGLFEAADGGTVLLDEIGELPLAAQAKLLRVIEERVVTRLGSARARPLDMRLIVATNRDLEAECVAGRFRYDLYFRLNGLTLSIPPLRERPTDIARLSHAFVELACRQMERSTTLRLSAESLLLLSAYRWPGNVRELKNTIARAIVLCDGEVILPVHLPGALHGPDAVACGQVEARSSSVPAAASLRGEIRSIERSRILDALARSAGVQTTAARLLGISRRTLISRIEEYGLPRPRKGQRVQQ